MGFVGGSGRLPSDQECKGGTAGSSTLPGGDRKVAAPVGA